MPNFQVGVNINAKLNRSFTSAFSNAKATANSAGRSIERSGRNAAAGFTGQRGLGPALSGALGGAATVAFLRRSVDTAIQLEKAEKAFRKVSGNLTRGQQDTFIEQLNRFATSGQTLSTVENLRRSAATIAQSGVDKGGVDLLQRWVRFAEQASIAFDVPLEQATQQIIELTNALAGDRSLEDQYKEADRLSDVITHLGNNTASSEKKILPFLHRVAGTTATFGIQAENAAAFGAALTGAGTPTEKAGTAFNAMLLILSDMEGASKRAKEGLQKLGISTGQLSRDWQRDADKTFFSFLKTLHEAGAERGAIAKAIFGTEHADEVLKVTSKAWATYTEALDLANDKSALFGARSREAKTQLEGVEKDVNQARNAWALFNEELGKAVFAAAKPALEFATPKLTQGASFLQQNPAVGTGIMGAAALLGLQLLGRMAFGGSLLGGLARGGKGLLGAGAGAAAGGAKALANVGKTGWRRWLFRGALAGGLAAIGGGIFDVLFNPAEAADATLTEAERRQAAQRRARPGRTWYTGASFERPAERPNYLTERSRVEIFDLPADMATEVPAITARPATAKPITTQPTPAVPAIAPREPKRVAREQTMIGSALAVYGEVAKGVWQALKALVSPAPVEAATRAQPAVPTIQAQPATPQAQIQPAVPAVQAPEARPSVTVEAVTPVEALQPRWPFDPHVIRLDKLAVTGGRGPHPWAGRYPDEIQSQERQDESPWDFRSNLQRWMGTPEPSTLPAPDSAPEVFDDYGSMASRPAGDTGHPVQVEANRPLPIDDGDILAELKRSNILLAQLVANRGGQRVSGTPFYDVPSYVNT